MSTFFTPVARNLHSGYTPQAFQKLCKTFLTTHYNIHELPCWQEGRVFVSGGLFPRLYYGQFIRDVDFYCNDAAAMNEMFEYLSNRSFVNTSSARAMETNTFRRLAGTSHSVDLIGFHEPRNRTYPLASFDFTICRFVYDRDGLTYLPQDWDDLINKRLVYTGNLGVRSRNNNSYTRIRKYEGFGFRISALDRDRIIEHRESLPEISEADSEY